MRQFALLLVFVCVLVGAGFIGALRLVLAFTRAIPFYAGVFSLTFICLLIVIATLVALKRTASKAAAAGGRVDIERSLERVVACVLCAFALNLCIFVAGPVALDRSVSTYLLSQMPPAGSAQGMPKQVLRDTFVTGYVDGMDAIGRGLEEHRVSGNVRETAPGEFARTERAELFLTVGKAIVKIYGMNPAVVAAD